MLQLDHRNVHEFAKVPGQPGAWRLKGIYPILRLSARGADDNTAVVLIQRGQAYSEGGQPIKRADLQPWFYDELSKCSPAALAEAGWRTEAPKQAKGD